MNIFKNDYVWAVAGLFYCEYFNEQQIMNIESNGIMKYKLYTFFGRLFHNEYLVKSNWIERKFHSDFFIYFYVFLR